MKSSRAWRQVHSGWHSKTVRDVAAAAVVAAVVVVVVVVDVVPSLNETWPKKRKM